MFFLPSINYCIHSCETVVLSNGLVFNVNLFNSFFQYFLPSVFFISPYLTFNAADRKAINRFNNDAHL